MGAHRRCQLELNFGPHTRLKSLVKVDANVLRGSAGVQEVYIDIFASAVARENDEGSCEFEVTPGNLTDLDKIGLPVRFALTVGKE